MSVWARGGNDDVVISPLPDYNKPLIKLIITNNNLSPKLSDE